MISDTPTPRTDAIISSWNDMEDCATMLAGGVLIGGKVLASISDSERILTAVSA